MQKIWSSSKAAIDLASVMVGVIVIGLIGGVIAATVFAVIPWGQDKAAKASLDSLVNAESAYRGYSSDPNNTTSSQDQNKYVSYQDLVTKKFIQQSDRLCAEPTNNGSSYNAAVKSDSGAVFRLTANDTTPVQVQPLETTCFGLMLPDGSFTPYTNPTVATFSCPSTMTLNTPFRNFTGVVAWSDGRIDKYTNSTVSRPVSISQQLTANVYGTFSRFSQPDSPTDQSPLCLQGVTQWNPDAGLTDMTRAFSKASNMTQLAPLPSSVTNISSIFYQTTHVRVDVTNWDTSNITDMTAAFSIAANFNQDISRWNTSKVTSFTNMFYGAESFNQPLNSWDVSKATTFSSMFNRALVFNQPLDNWNTSSATNMASMFRDTIFNQPLNSWNVSNVTNLSQMFYNARYNQPLNNWKTSNVTSMSQLFWNNSVFNQNIESWDVSNANSFSSLFKNATSFNQPLNNWNISKASSFTDMFSNARSFNQPLDKWQFNQNTNVVMDGMFRNAPAFNQNISNWNTSSVVIMNEMFLGASTFNQNISNWNTSKVLAWTSFRVDSPLTTANTPLKFR